MCFDHAFVEGKKNIISSSESYLFGKTFHKNLDPNKAKKVSRDWYARCTGMLILPRLIFDYYHYVVHLYCKYGVLKSLFDK